MRKHPLEKIGPKRDRDILGKKEGEKMLALTKD